MKSNVRKPAHTISAGVLALASISTAFLAGVALITFYQTESSGKNIVPIFPPTVPLASEALVAKSAVLYDPTSGRVLFAKNADTRRPLASLTKLMAAEVVLEGHDAATKVTITKSDLAPEGDWGLRVGDVLSLHDLLRLGLIASSNDAMAAAAASLGPGYLTEMNKTAVALGLSQSYFLNSTGLDLNTETSGGYGSAYDVARLAAHFYAGHSELFESTSDASVRIHESGRTLSSAATSIPLQTIPGFIGAKTGYTTLAGGNLVAVFDIEIGHPLVAVVLGSTKEGRFQDVQTLIAAARESSRGAQ